MRNLAYLAVAALAAALSAAPAVAADLPEDPYLPPVDYDIGGSFYLRGSAALNLHWAREIRHVPEWTGQIVNPIDRLGYGYSWGAGFGYETGDGLRFDVTIDTLETAGLRVTKPDVVGPDVPGEHTLLLRSTLALANVYYDFSFGDLGGFGGYGGEGGMFGYVGAGAGLAWNTTKVNFSPTDPTSTFDVPPGTNISAAAALMAGVGYDMGTWVADVGYRGIYINQINNSPTNPATNPGKFFMIDHNFIHELRGTVRYRFN